MSLEDFVLRLLGIINVRRFLSSENRSDHLTGKYCRRTKSAVAES